MEDPSMRISHFSSLSTQRLLPPSPRAIAKAAASGLRRAGRDLWIVDLFVYPDSSV